MKVLKPFNSFSEGIVIPEALVVVRLLIIHDSIGVAFGVAFGAQRIRIPLIYY